MAAESVFVDTNVLVYVTRPSAPQHAAAAAVLMRLEAQGAVLWVSPQVLREYLAVVTREQATAPALTSAAAVADVQRFRKIFEVAGEGMAGIDRLLELVEDGRGSGRHVHDANIVATMIEHRIRRLLTFNDADFRRFSRIIDIEPLP